MRRFLCTVLCVAGISPAIADEVPMTISDCLGVLAGLQALDAGARVIVAQGKPTESVETIRFKFPAKVRDAISHNLFVLGQVQQEAQAANRRAQMEVSRGDIKPGSRENIEFDARMADYVARPCRAELDHIRDADLDLDRNDVPASTLALLTRIRDR
jgi:hypothetical protein